MCLVVWTPGIVGLWRAAAYTVQGTKALGERTYACSCGTCVRPGGKPPDTPLNALALYHLTVSHGSRSSGQSAAAKLAYVSRVERYAQRAGLQHVESANLPAWANDDASAFWQAVDEHSRANGRLYTEIEFALPKQLSPRGGLELAREMAWDMSIRPDGQVPFTMAVHSDGHNPHVHLVLSSRIDDGKDRPTTKDWFNQVASKRSTKTVGGVPAWSRETDKEWLEKVRSKWADLANRALEKAQHLERVDHRSYLRRGIDQVPTMHEGWAPKTRELRQRTNTKARQLNDRMSKARQLVELAKRELAQEQAAAKRPPVRKPKAPAPTWTEAKEATFQAEANAYRELSRQAAEATGREGQRQHEVKALEALLHEPQAIAEAIYRAKVNEQLGQAFSERVRAQQAADVAQRSWLGFLRGRKAARELSEADARYRRLEAKLEAGVKAAPAGEQQLAMQQARSQAQREHLAQLEILRQRAQEAARAAEQAQEARMVQAERLKALEAVKRAAQELDRAAGQHQVQPPALRPPEVARERHLRGRGLDS